MEMEFNGEACASLFCGSCAMSTDLRAVETLDLTQLELPPSLPITGMEVEEYVDWTGDEALRVTLIIDESVDAARTSGGDVIQLKSAVREAIRALGVREFVYIRLVKESERRQAWDSE
jgi:hypothetical protein